MLIVVSYDVPDDRRRTKLAHALKDFGVRVQYSVFECLLEPAQVDALSAKVRKLIDPARDSVRLYRFCADCGARTEVQGLGKPTEDPEVYVLGKQSICLTKVVPARGRQIGRGVGRGAGGPIE